MAGYGRSSPLFTGWSELEGSFSLHVDLHIFNWEPFKSPCVLAWTSAGRVLPWWWICRYSQTCVHGRVCAVCVHRCCDRRVCLLKFVCVNTCKCLQWARPRRAGGNGASPFSAGCAFPPPLSWAVIFSLSYNGALWEIQKTALSSERQDGITMEGEEGRWMAALYYSEQKSVSLEPEL